MEFEDSKNAIFCDPHAFIQGHNKTQPQKVVFAEPYDCLPSFYINNDFKKRNCDCITKPCPPKPPKPCAPQFPFNFDLKAIMPILAGLLGKNDNVDFAKLLGNMPSNENGNGSFDLSKIAGLVAQNPQILQSVLSLFKGGELKNFFKKNKPNKKTITQTDHIINNYTRVEN